MRACDTCAHLKVPADPDHAKNYRVCMVVTPLPANVIVLDRARIEGRVECPRRWLTIKTIETRLGLKDCEMHQPLITKDRHDHHRGDRAAPSSQPDGSFLPAYRVQPQPGE